MRSTTFRIGGDLTVGRLGFGAMYLPTERPEDRKAAITVARRAVELGITLIDTAHMYEHGGRGHRAHAGGAGAAGRGRGRA